MSSHPQQVRAALIQQAFCAERRTNMERLNADIREAAAQGAQLVVLPELHNSLYFCQTEDTAQFDLAEPIPGPSTEVLGALAQTLHIVIVASLFEKRAPGIYHNTAVVLDADGKIAGRYRKMHIPDDPGYYEKFYFTPGDLDFRPIATRVGKLGVLVCWDQWFPEAARLMALSGAQVLIYPTAIGWDPHDEEQEKTRQREAWITVQRAHAVANGIPVMSCNRTGFESHPTEQATGIDFWGTSFIAGPQGEMLAQAPVEERAILAADLDFRHAEDVRRIWPFFRDRRIDAYEPLRLRFRD